MTDREPEQLELLMRDALRHRAHTMGTSSGLAAAARETALQRRRAKRGVAGVAAAVLLVPGAIWATNEFRTSAGQSSADSPTPAHPAPSSNERVGDEGESLKSAEVPARWRLESYRGVQLRVPPHWGWGASPIHGERLVSAEPTICGRGDVDFPASNVAGESPTEMDFEGAYVGRPIGLSDVCIGGASESAPHVWFDSPLPPSGAETVQGLVTRTVNVGWQRITVATRDVEQLEMIIGTAEGVVVDAHGCAAEIRAFTDDTEAESVSTATVERLSVCVYRFDQSTAGSAALLYSTELESADEAQRVVDEISATAPVDDPRGCRADVRGQPIVLLRFGGDQVSGEIFVSFNICGPGYLLGPGVRPFTAANLAPWAVDGVRTYVNRGQLGGAVADFFDGIYG